MMAPYNHYSGQNGEHPHSITIYEQGAPMPMPTHLSGQQNN